MYSKSDVSDYFQEQQLKKRTEFFEKAHAAFILNTLFCQFGRPTDDQLSWLFHAYPKSRVEAGDSGTQDENFYIIEPKF
jgi:hypothetical protein